MTRMPTLRVQLLGPFRVLIDDRAVPERAWRSHRATALVTLLALAPDHRLHREVIRDTLWPELDPEAQANNLNVSVTRARAALAATGAPPGLFLVRSGSHLLLGPPYLIHVDAQEFESAAADARRGAVQEPAALEAALRLYRGEPLPDDRYEPWAEEPRRRLRAQALELLARLAERHLEAGAIDPAIHAFQRLLALDPADEDVTSALMRLHAGQGHPGQALAQFDCLVTTLRDELDAEPRSETVALADQIRRMQATPRPMPVPTAPAQSLRVESGPLPIPLDPLIGREREVSEVGRLLSQERLLTLTGPGGIGKTRLALAAAAHVSERFTAGVVFVDLAPIREPALVGLAIAERLNLRTPGGQDVTLALEHYLEPRQLLLLLDNFEQVVEAAPLLARLLRAAPQLTVLVTSRMRLRLSGEIEYLVPPLPVPDAAAGAAGIEIGQSPAVTLFVERARQIQAGFHPGADRMLEIAEICRRVDGLPLGIELAAARVKVLTPAAMLSRLERPLTLLASEARDRPERHQTMRRMIAWSHDLLSAPERRFFRRLAIFWGGWTLEAAEEVTGDDDLGIDPLDGLTSLVDKSLVVRQEDADGIRFRMLETLRDFGREQLAGHGELERIGDRHVAWALAFAEHAAGYLESSEQAVWLERLDREAANMRAAIAWTREHGDAERGMRLAIALRMYWFIRGNLQEGIPQSRAVLDLPGGRAFPVLRADLLNSLGLMCRDGDAALADRFCSESRDISRQAGDRQREADALANLAYIALDRGDLDETQTLATGSLKLSQELGNQQGIADMTSVLALVAFGRGELDAARSLHERSVAIWESLDDWQGVIWARTRLAALLVRIGDLATASEALAWSYEMAGKIGFRWGLSWSLDAIAHLAIALNRFDLSARAANLAAAVRVESGLPPARAEQADIDALWQLIAAATGRTPDEAMRNAAGGVARDLDGIALIRVLGRIVSERNLVDERVRSGS